MRSLVVVVLALSVAVVAGVAVGMRWPGLSGGSAVSEASSAENLPASQDLGQPLDQNAGLAEVVHRFSLAPLDVRETLESAALAVTDDGRVHLAWASRPSADQWEVLFSTSSDRGATFSAPRRVATSQVHRTESKSRGKSVTREVRILPRLAASGNDLYLGWVEAAADNSSVNYLLAKSVNGGETFHSPAHVHGWAQSRPTYTGLTATPDGHVAASWLDNRRGKQLPSATVRGPDAPMFVPEWPVFEHRDQGVCPCCPTAVAISDDGRLFLAYRDQINGYRDMWIAQKQIDEPLFKAPVPISEPRWTFDGCPHDGPSLAIAGDRLHIAWMDGSSGQPRVYLAASGLELDGFKPREAASASHGTQGHPCLVADRNDGLHLVWDEGLVGDGAQFEPMETAVHAGGDDGHGHHGLSQGETARVIFYSNGKDIDCLAAPLPVAPVDDGFQTRPIVAASSDRDVYVAWTELTEQGRTIAVARLKQDRK